VAYPTTIEQQQQQEMKMYLGIRPIFWGIWTTILGRLDQPKWNSMYNCQAVI